MVTSMLTGFAVTLGAFQVFFMNHLLMFVRNRPLVRVGSLSIPEIGQDR